VKLEEIWLGGDQALVTCKRLLKTWKTLYDMEIERSVSLMSKYARKHQKRTLSQNANGTLGMVVSL
jgi:hypothetical protein